ncbi:polynucleotide kinase-phosphatase [Domibacillus sp. PGB-M46]|uniref:polynucleotide kinase-phosphatase n=1 Tax=Domibacillus sp. PGB-M46 TaxID=2910255 RepID=UPI001F5A932E|nr:polynucleotide kinase-phosphatase [Domibacillus sp. PGB-M46]MCI2254191.1 polynucleotide kinase-phosphatase [Domibacillus sp. PGB-M46]
MNISLPHAGIVLLIGPSNSGKSTLLQTKIDQGEIKQSEVISSDAFRLLVNDEEFMEWRDLSKGEVLYAKELYQRVSQEAFAMMDALIETRCRLNKLSIIDATNLHPDDRKRYVDIARKHHLPITAILLDTEESVLLNRDEARKHPRGKRRVRQQYQTFKREKHFVKKEGYKAVYTINTTKEIHVHRHSNPLEIDIGQGIDVIGDIHGCFEEMIALLEKLGYVKNEQHFYVHPEGRRFLSLGDIMSRGPMSLETMLFFCRHVKEGLAYMIDSNHGWKIARWLDKRKVTLSHGDERVKEELDLFEVQNGKEQTEEIKNDLKEFLLKAPSHYVLTRNGSPVLVCTHAGIKDEFIGRQSPAVQDFCRYGDTDGLDEKGKPVRKDWFTGHKQQTLIVWGHDPKPRPLVINNTINIDQGVVFGGKLTAFRYPEKEYVSVQAKKDYAGVLDNPLTEWEKARLNPPNIGAFLNGYSVLTKELGEVQVAESIVKPAIDAVSHVTVPIEQLVYIPPTMSPTPDTSAEAGFLEHPAEAFRYYRDHGITKMIAEKKHMGSRAVLLLFKDCESSKKHIGINSLGVIYTRSGRRFFSREQETELLAKLCADLTKGGYFNNYETDFVLMDAEIMPWNLKAKELISSQYAHVAENAVLDRTALVEKLGISHGNQGQVQDWLREYEQKLENAHTFKQVFQKYCWDVQTMDDIQIAPFHILAHSGKTFFDQPHIWHMEMNRLLAGMSDYFIETDYKVITSEDDEKEVIKWWEEMTKDGHEGIVIKPEFFVAHGKGKLIQPAIKVRGQKYLHIIYGMDYLEPQNLERLKKRNTGKKQKMALKEFALGIEGIERFVNKESIERIHGCTLAVLALESDPVIDPRL